MLTGHMVIELGISRFGGAASLAKRIRMRELTDAADVAAPLRRWAKADGPAVPADVAIRVLDELGAIRWEAFDDLPSRAAAVGDDARRFRERTRQALDHAAEEDRRPPRETRRSLGGS